MKRPWSWRYIIPRRLTLHPYQFEGYSGLRHCYRWLWWNFVGRPQKGA